MKISGRQFTILVIMNVLGTAIITVPAIVSAYGKQNGWFSVLLATIFGIGMVVVYNAIYKKNPDKNIYQQLELLFGKWIGKLLSFLFMLFAFHITIGNLRVMGDFITTQILIETPVEMVMFLALITCFFGVRYGIEVIARAAEIFFPYIILSIFLLLILVTPEAEITNIQPILQTDVAGAFAGALPLLGYPFLEMVLFLAFMQNVNNKRIEKQFLVGVTIGGLLLVVITLVCLLVLGVDMTTRNIYPTYILGKKISIADFLERIEILVAIIWFFTIFFKITIGYYVLIIGFKQLLQLKDYKTTTIPFVYVLLVFAVFMRPSVVEQKQFLTSAWIPFSLTFGLVLPVLMLVAGLFKNKKGGQQQSP